MISKKKIFFEIIIITFIITQFSIKSFGIAPISINKIKNLYLDTVLTDKNRARAVLVCPAINEYENSINFILNKIKSITGVSIPILEDTVIPEDILDSTTGSNVIALGNMSTNAFIEKLYRQWYVLLDLKYPGKGGYIVRTLHNPFGTGQNVIFIGGSDDIGVTEAAIKFCNLLEPATPLKVGRLMEIKLGKNMVPPEIGDDIPIWVVHSWRDSWRECKDSGIMAGFPPSTLFGWNPISIAGILYYMSGKEQYLDCFKAMAIPDPNSIPLQNRIDKAFNDPIDPLVKNHHYYSHLVDCVYDLIEESPLFSNEERLLITNKLLLHQYHYDSNHTYSKPNGDRHTLWHMMNIYTGSRYFSKYYPNDVWDQRIKNVRAAMNSFIGNPTWGEKDTLEWVSTSIEPVFEFFLLDGFDNFIVSNTAKTMMDALEILMTGNDKDYYNCLVSISLLNKAAHMLNNTRYIWMLKRLCFDFNVFRIGQSYWHPTPTPHPPYDLINKISIYPLAKTDWENAGKTIPLNEGFQILSYRSGLTKKDDYLLLDGFCGLGRKQYHLNTINILRMFQGQLLLNGYSNDVDIWYNGMADSQAARCVSLKESFGTDGVAFIKTEVPHMNSSGWHRYLLYIKDKAFISVDNIIANKNGIFDIICSWERSGNNIGQKRFSGYLEEGEQIIFPHLFDNNGLSNSIRYINEGAWFVSGTNSAFIGIENYASDILSCDADFAYFDSNIIFLAEAKKLVLDGKVIFSANEPVTCLWKLHNNLFEIHAYQPCSLSLATVSDAIPSGITQGEHNYTDVIPQSDLVNRILPSVLGELEIVSEGTKDNSSSVDPNINWKSVWVLNLNEEESEGITHIVSSKVARHKNIWVATNGELFSRIIKITAKGEILKSINYDSEILSMNSLDYTENANNLTLLVGFKDDKLRALSENGEELWHFKATIHPSFRIGDRYDAPWFTDPNPPYDMTGIFSILVDDLCGKGSEKIIIGRPCTIEFHALNGDLINSVPTRWGNNTSLAILRNRGTSNENTLLLAGKYFTGYPGITGINQDYKNISDNLFSSLVKGHFNMNAWMQRGLGHMIVEDVDNNGIDEVIFTLSGHWNELRLYSGETGEPLWALHFGPDTWGGNFMRALKVIDINKDGFKEIIVGLKSGTICSFDYKGNLIWQFRHHNGSSINCMDTMNNAKGILAVGFEDGCISMLDSNGHVVLNGRLGSSIQSIICTDAFVYAGTENGILGKYHIPGTSPRPPILRLLYH